jgi:2-polyprenyl-6-methoxyphenol hydroxylase-like FAD-dependent oxidoreductase
VLVVGGGAAGLTTGVVLGDLGIPALVIERRPDVSSFPRATALTHETMALFRRWGIEPAVRRVGFAAHLAMSMRATLVGPELSRIPFDDHAWTCAQDHLEPILCERARAAGTRVAYGCELTGLQATEQGLLATVREVTTGARRAVRARFVVGADGASSRVRDAVGIALSRTRDHGHYLSILFRSPLRMYTGDPPDMVYGIANTDPLGVILPTDATNRWVRGMPWRPEAGERLADYDESRCAAVIRLAVGVAELPVTILAVQAFRMRAALVDHYRAGRVVLVGDAAHSFTPTTGMGLNIAIQDGVAVARCLAQALQTDETPERGAAFEAFETFEAERRPEVERVLAAELAGTDTARA